MKSLLCFSIFLIVSLSLGAQTNELGPSVLNRFGVPSTLLSFPPTLSSTELNLIESEEGRATLSFGQGTSLLNVETGGNTYTSSIENLGIRRQGDLNFVTGENLRFSSSTSSTTSGIDRFSFGGSETEFRFDLEEFNTVGARSSYGAERLSFSRTENTDEMEVANLYVRRADGSFVEIGEGNYSSEDKRISLLNIAGQSEGYNFSADQLKLFREGQSDLGEATNIYISNESGEFITVGSANIEITPDQRSINLRSLTGNAQGYIFSAESLEATETESELEVNAKKVFIQNQAGDFIQVGEADYNSANESLNMTSVLGRHEAHNFSADQVRLMRRGNSDLGEATNLFIENGEGDFIQVGRANIELNPAGNSLAMSDISGETTGYSFSASSFDSTQRAGATEMNGTGIFIRNNNGDFVQIGEGSYSSSDQSLELTSITGGYKDLNLTADQIRLIESGELNRIEATNLFVADNSNRFISVGSASFELGSDRSSLLLNSLNGEASGYRLSADQVSAESLSDNFRVEVLNGRAVKGAETLSFGSSVTTGNSSLLSTEVRNLRYSDKDLSFTSNNLRASTNGESLSLNTTGVLTTDGKRLDLTFRAAEVNSISMSGPGDDGGILLERNGEGKVVKAAGQVSIGTTEEGGISELAVALGDTVSFSAVDADGNARELSAEFLYDKAQGKFYLRTVFKGGDQTEIKVMPFKFTSEKVGEDAVAALSASIEKQNIGAYLRTMSGIIDLQRVNDFLAVGKDRMQVRLGKQRGMEFYYANNSLSILDDGDGFNQGSDGKDIALGLGFFNRGADNSVRSGGLLLSSDSSLRYQVESGTLSFSGIELADSGEIPLTIGTYYRYEDDEGNAILGTLGTSLADLGSVSAGVTVERRLTANSRYSVGLAGNTNGDVAASMGFTITFPKVNNSNRFSGGKSTYYSPSDVSDIYNSVRGLDR